MVKTNPAGRNYDTAAGTPLNYTLKRVQLKRPRATLINLDEEHIVLRNQIRNMVDYLEAGGQGRGSVPIGQPQEISTQTDQAISLIS